MYPHVNCRCHRFLVGALSVIAIACTQAWGQETLRIYGSEGPEPAIRQAADTFAERTNVRVEVVTGPPDKWLQRAVGEADVVYASAAFMMQDFVRTEGLHVDEATVTPLYLRPSAVLVRPGNPKGIHDFPDLLRPGTRVMVVSGSGQTGLWEDMAGKTGDMQVIRAFRENIAVSAANSTEAMKLWDKRDDIDAWVTWNIWHMPLRDRAQLIEVSDDYLIYRQCSIALTERGKAKPSAQQFIDFLVSSDGARIFESWHWMAQPQNAELRGVGRDIAIVCRIDSDDWKNGVGAGLAFVRGLVGAYRSVGTPRDQRQIVAVVHGSPAYWLLKDESYAEFRGREGPNPNKTIIKELSESGVSIELCSETMKKYGWEEEDLLSGVKIVPNAYQRIVDLELQGYAYIRF